MSITRVRSPRQRLRSTELHVMAPEVHQAALAQAQASARLLPVAQVAVLSLQVLAGCWTLPNRASTSFR